MSVSVIFRSFLAKIPRRQPYLLANIGSFSSLFNLQSKSINFNFGHLSLIFGRNTKAIALLFGQNWLIFITFHSAIKFNQFQFRSFVAHFWPKYQGNSLTFWPKLAHFHHFSICNQSQSISLSVICRLIFGQITKAIALLFCQHWLNFITFQSAIKINQFQFRSFLAHFWPKYQGYSLTVLPTLAHFHHFSICNQNQSISVSVIFRSFLAKIPRLQPDLLAKIGSFSSLFNLHSKSINFIFGQFSLTFWPNYQGYSLTFWPILAHFHHFSLCNQIQSISGSVIFRSYLAKIPRLQPYLLAKIGSFSSLFNLQSKSINFTFGHYSLNFWPNYQGYSLTFLPTLAHVHHFSICNQNQSISVSVIFGSYLAKIPRLQPYCFANIGSFSSLFNLQSKSINVSFGHFSLILGQNTKAIALPVGQYWLIFITFQSAIKINQFQFRSFVAHFWPKYQGYSLTVWPKLAHFHHFSLCNQIQSISVSVICRSFLAKIPRQQPYLLAKIGSFSSLFNLQSKSINFTFGHLSLNFWPNYKGYSLTFLPTLAQFHHFSICNQNQSISVSVIFGSFLAKIPRLQPYCFANIGSFSSLFNLQSKSINFNFGHFSLIFGQNTKAIALLFGQNWLIFITFHSAIKFNQFHFRSYFAHFWPKYQGYSLTFWRKLAHFHHFSICNQSQSMSVSVIFRSCVAKLPRLQPYFLAKIGSFSSLFTLQSNSINFSFGHFWLIFGQNTKAIALLFCQHWLIFITFQSAIKINQFQFRSFFAHFWPKYQGYSLTFWPKLAHFHHFSICTQNQSISFSVSFRLLFGQTTKAIALLFGQYWLIFITFHSAIKFNQFQVRSFFAHIWPKYQGYSLTFWPKLAHFHHFSICNQSQSISLSVIIRLIFGQITKAIALLFCQHWLMFITFQSAIKINQFQFRSFLAHIWPKYQGYSLTVLPTLAHFHHFSICNQNQSMSVSVIFRSFLAKIPRLQPYLLANIGSFSSLFNLQSKSINFNFGHLSLIFGRNTKAIALLFGQNWLIFITFHSAIKFNQFQFRSFVAHFWPKYQGNSLTFWPKLAHFHHFSICNQSQSISLSVICRLIFGQITKAIALLFCQHWLNFITFQSAIKINQFQFRSFLAHFWPRYQGYSLTVLPILAHFHHFSICNQNQSISISVIVCSFLAKIPRLQPYFLAKIGSFSSLFTLQSNSINFTFGHISLIFGQNTKAIALPFGENWLIFIIFQSAIKVNQCQFRSFFAHVWPNYQGYSLTFWPKLAHFHHFSLCNQIQSISISVIFRSFLAKLPRLQPYCSAKIGSFSSLFNLHSQSINFNFGHFSLISRQNTKAIALLFGQTWLIFIIFQSALIINQFQFRSFFAHFSPNHQGYSLTFWPKLAHFHHFSIWNQNQSISGSVILRSFLAKIPRLLPYFFAKIGSFSSLFNLQSKSINFNFGHFSLNFWPNYQGYSLTFWPILAHFHHFSICNQNQSISISVIFRSFLAEIPRLQPYVLAKIGSFSSLFTLQSNSINFSFGHFVPHLWPKYQGYSLTFWPKLAHFHHFSICNQSQSISLSVICRVIFGQITKAIALLFGRNWLIFITFQSAIKINQFQFRSFLAHFWPKYQGYSLTVLPTLAHFHHCSICNQNQSISVSVIFRSFLAKIPRLQPYLLAKIGSFSSLFNLQSKSINFTFGHFSLNFWPNYQGYSLTFWPILAHFHHFSICNQSQSSSTSVIFRSCVAKLPRLQPYFLANIVSFSSLFTLQSNSINFTFGHFSLIFGQTTKAIALLFGQNWLIFITFQSALTINQFQFRSFFAHFSPNHQGYSLTFWPILAHFHHFSICNQNQSISISVIFRSFLAEIPRLQPYVLAKIGSFSSLFTLQSNSINFSFGHVVAHLWLKYQGYSLTFWPKLAHFHHFSICNQSQSISLSVICRVIFGQITKAIVLLFGRNWLIFITFQSAIKINQFQFRSFLAHFWPKYQGYSLTVLPTLAHFHHCSICNQNQSISVSVIFRSFLAKIPRLQPYLLAKIGSFSSLFNLQSKSINFTFGHFSLNFWPNYQGYSLTFWPILAHFHHFSICNQSQSSSTSVIFRSCVAKLPRLQPYFLANIVSFSSLFTLQSNSINFTFGHFSLISPQTTKAIALLFGQNWLIFISFQSGIKINEFQVRSFFAHFWPKYQGYSLTFWPKLAHFHHFSICNHNQSISISVTFRSFLAKIPRLQPYFLANIGSFSSLFNLQSKSINFNFGHFSLIFGQNTKAIALLFGQNWLIFFTFHSAVKFNQFQFRSLFAHYWPKYQGYSLTYWPKLAHFHHISICNQSQSISLSVIFRLIFGQTTKAIALLFGQNWLIFITFQSAIIINQFQFRSHFAHFWPKYQCYSLTFWPKLAHFHHFSICNHNQSISISVTFRSFLAKIPRLQPYFLANIGSFSSLFNLQSKSINFTFGHFSLNFWPNYQGYSLTLWPKLAHFHHISICNQSQSISLSVIFRLIFGQTTKAIALLFGQNWLIFITFQSAIKLNQCHFRSVFAHFSPNYQGYSLTFWPKLAHFHHCSICNQNQSISLSVIFRLLFGQITKAMALLFGQYWLIFITFQSAIKINQFQFLSFFAHFWPKYQGYSLTFLPTLAHFHHFSICNQNQSMSTSVIFCSCVAKLPRLQPYFLAKIGSFSSLFTLQSNSITFTFGHFSLNFWPNYQGYSLTLWPKLAHFHHCSICTHNQSISISVIFRSFLAKPPRLQPYFLAKIGSFSSFFNLESKSINFSVGHSSLIFGQTTKAIALLFGQNWLIFITFQSAIIINQFQCRSHFAHFWPKYQGYSLTFWPKLAHFHHFSIWNQNQSISVSVILRSFLAKIPRLQPYFLAKIGSFSSLFTLQSNSINFSFGHCLLIIGQNTKAIALPIGQNWLIFITFQSAIKVNQFHFRSFFA